MKLILNEKSLDGQFASMEEFYYTLPVMSRNLKILYEQRIPLEKHSSLYSRKITKDQTFYELKNRRLAVEPAYRDQVRNLKREMSKLIQQPPFWDSENTKSKDSIEEAARLKTDVLSFQHPDYADTVLQIAYHGGIREIKSAVSCQYLLDILKGQGQIDVLTYLQKAFTGNRLVMEQLDAEGKSVLNLQKAELDELIEALKRFEEAESWEFIMSDRFFDFKSYKPAQKDHFSNKSFKEKRIYKFRCGQHSQIRCFGYREGEKFYVVEVERDHSISDTG